MHPVEAAIMKTICYADIFDYPQSRTEIYDKLISPSKVAVSSVESHLSKLHADGAICLTGSYFHLPEKSRLVRRRSKRKAYSAEKYCLAETVAGRLIRLPYVMAVFLTGAVAVGNAHAQDDIDLMIVAAPHSLWSCRLWVNLWLDAGKLRRRPGDKQVSNKMCPNLFLTADSLAVPLKQRNLYTAHEVIQVKPLIDPLGLHHQFIEANRWCSTFLGNYTVGWTVGSKVKNKGQKRPSPLWFETLVRQAQFAYMYPKKNPGNRRCRCCLLPSA